MRAHCLGSWQSQGGTCTDHSFCPGYHCRPEDEVYDEDGNPLPDLYDSDPPGVGSPASALRDAYALYYPTETRYKPRGFCAAPGLRWWEGQGSGPPSRFFFIKALKAIFSLGWFPQQRQKVSSGCVCVDRRAAW